MERGARFYLVRARGPFNGNDHFRLARVARRRADDVELHTVDSNGRRSNGYRVLSGIFRFVNALGRRIIEVHPLISRISSVAAERFEREYQVAVRTIACERIFAAPAVIHASHAKRAHHAIECDIEIVHHRMERLRFPIRINK